MVFLHHHILTIVLFTPLAGIVPLVFISGTNQRAIRGWSNLVMLAGFLVSLPLVLWFAHGSSGQQFKFVEDYAWIPSLGARYFLGIDGISLLLIMLTTVLGCVAALSSGRAAEARTKEYYIMLLSLQTSMLGAFMSLDLFLFYFFWEAMLVPLYFLIGVWGGPRKLYAAMKFFLYALAGSLVMLLGILALCFHYHADTGAYTFSITALAQHANAWPLHLQVWVFWAFMAAFAIRIPMFPFHTWLPDALVEAPVAVSVIVSGVFLKMGTYGFLRLSLPLLPKASSNSTMVQIMVVLSIVAIIYGALLTLMQRDIKRLVACSCVSGMGFCTLGIFALNPHGLSGSIIQQVNHGICIAALFLIVGVVYERRQTCEIRELAGLAKAMPVFATLVTIVVLASMGLPLLNGFVGEFTILQGVFEANEYWAAWAAAGVVLAAAYLLWFYQRTMLAPSERAANHQVKDLTWLETMMLLPLVLWIFWIGIYPKPFFQALEKPVSAIVEVVNPHFYDRTGQPVAQTSLFEVCGFSGIAKPNAESAGIRSLHSRQAQPARSPWWSGRTANLTIRGLRYAESLVRKPRTSEKEICAAHYSHKRP